MQQIKQPGQKTILLLCTALIVFFFTWNFHLHESFVYLRDHASVKLLINLIVVVTIALLLNQKGPAFRPVSTTLMLIVGCSVFVLLFHFWHSNRPWVFIDTQISLIEIVLTVVSLLIVVWGGYTAVKQLQISAAASRETAQSNKLTAFQCMLGILQKESARERRMRIYALFDDQNRRLREPDVEKWSAEARQDVHDALAELDQIGLMVKYGLLDYEFLEGWDYTIYKILHIAREQQQYEEKKYVHRIRTSSGTECQSNYYLGIAELRRRKSHEFDFDDPAETPTRSE